MRRGEKHNINFIKRENKLHKRISYHFYDIQDYHLKKYRIKIKSWVLFNKTIKKKN